MSALDDIRARIDSAVRQEARQTERRERAKEDLVAALSSMEADFGVKSVTDAVALKAKLEAEQAEELANLEKVLDDLGA